MNARFFPASHSMVEKSNIEFVFCSVHWLQITAYWLHPFAVFVYSSGCPSMTVCTGWPKKATFLFFIGVLVGALPS